jgi:hypothetical protein
MLTSISFLGLLPMPRPNFLGQPICFNDDVETLHDQANVMTSSTRPQDNVSILCTMVTYWPIEVRSQVRGLPPAASIGTDRLEIARSAQRRKRAREPIVRNPLRVSRHPCPNMDKTWPLYRHTSTL